MNCKKCGADISALPVQNKIGAKSGKPYRARICECHAYNFVNDSYAAGTPVKEIPGAVVPPQGAEVMLKSGQLSASFLLDLQTTLNKLVRDVEQIKAKLVSPEVPF